MYKLGPYMVAKPCRKSRQKYNIEIGGSGFCIGVHHKHVKTESFISAHWKHKDHPEQDSITIMDDGKILAVYDHEDN